MAATPSRDYEPTGVTRPPRPTRTSPRRSSRTSSPTSKTSSSTKKTSSSTEKTWGITELTIIHETTVTETDPQPTDADEHEEDTDGEDEGTYVDVIPRETRTVLPTSPTPVTWWPDSEDITWKNPIQVSTVTVTRTVSSRPPPHVITYWDESWYDDEDSDGNGKPDSNTDTENHPDWVDNFNPETNYWDLAPWEHHDPEPQPTLGSVPEVDSGDETASDSDGKTDDDSDDETDNDTSDSDSDSEYASDAESVWDRLPDPVPWNIPGYESDDE